MSYYVCPECDSILIDGSCIHCEGHDLPSIGDTKKDELATLKLKIKKICNAKGEPLDRLGIIYDLVFLDKGGIMPRFYMTVMFEADDPDSMMDRITQWPFGENKIGSIAVWNLDDRPETEFRNLMEHTNPDLKGHIVV